MDLIDKLLLLHFSDHKQALTKLDLSLNLNLKIFLILHRPNYHSNNLLFFSVYHRDTPILPVHNLSFNKVLFN